VLSAVIMDAFTDKVDGAIWGFRFILWVSILGLFWLVAAWIVAERRYRHYGEMEEEEKDQVQDLPHFSQAEYELELWRRRAHSNSF
jgi:hypothetical protein